MSKHTHQSAPVIGVSPYANGISVDAMALILKRLGYGAKDTAQALYENYPVLLADELAEILTESSLYPNLDRNQLIDILGFVGYDVAQTLNAATPLFPEIQVTDFEELKGVIGIERHSRVMSFTSSGKARWNMSYEQADYYYNQPSGPAVEITDASSIEGHGMFRIGRVKDKYKKMLIGPYSIELFPTPDDIKQQIINLMAYGLQQVYPPASS